ncbi:MAG: hypothetical protein ACXQS4_05495 [Methermicoccaceae archaeon]
MAKVMNVGFQKATLKKVLKKHGIAPDTVDLDALIDSTLSYPENRANILKHLGVGGKRASTKKERRASDEAYCVSLNDECVSGDIEACQQLHEHCGLDEEDIQSIIENVEFGRTERANRMDIAKQAKRVFKKGNAKGVLIWAEHPNHYDIVGVDGSAIKLVKEHIRKKHSKKGKKRTEG